MLFKNLEVYNFKRDYPLITADTKSNNVILNTVCDLIIIDKRNTSKIKLWLIKLIL